MLTFCQCMGSIKAATTIVMQCHYNAVDFLQNLHNKHSIAHHWGWGMGCLLWVQTLIYVTSESLQYCMQYDYVILDRIIRTADGINSVFFPSSLMDEFDIIHSSVLWHNTKLCLLFWHNHWPHPDPVSNPHTLGAFEWGGHSLKIFLTYGYY